MLLAGTSLGLAALLGAPMGSLTINPSLYKNLRYVPVKSFEPITLTHNTSNLLVIRPDVPAMSAPDMVRQMGDAGIEVRLSSPQEFAALIRSDSAKWAEVVQRSGVRLD